jgi:hypothetical protein
VGRKEMVTFYPPLHIKQNDAKRIENYHTLDEFHISVEVIGSSHLSVSNPALLCCQNFKL